MSTHPAGPRSASISAPAVTVASADEAQRADVWPETARWELDGLHIGGVSAEDLAESFGTPLFVMDEQTVRHRARDYKRAYAGHRVFYAAKAFLSIDLARWMMQEGIGIDVCTLGELHVALAAGVPGEMLLMHGNNKSLEELEAAVDARVGYIVVDSFEEIQRLTNIAIQRLTPVNVLVRVTVGVEAHTHEFIATAHEDQKFGFSLATGAAKAAAMLVDEVPGLRFAGLHSHIGSQIFDEQGFLIAVSRLVRLCAELKHEGVEVSHLNLGGGAGIAYLPSDDPATIEDLAGKLISAVEQECDRAGVEHPIIMVEPGRSIVGPAGVTLYSVGSIKPVTVSHDVVRWYVSVDGGMSDNIRTALYDADYTIAHAMRLAYSEMEQHLVRVVGKHCESGDIVVKQAKLLADVVPGEVLAVAATGAYCRSMASNYNHTPRPAVVSVCDGTARVMLRRETVQDLLALDEGKSAS
ncbi:MAG: diaminopimelate decarboxylase [Actinobacteria bacterium]|nr:diaminopimelate decarboxylase [Actinomycetota bacterium]